MKQRIDPFGDDTVTLRPVEERDLAMILGWRNRDDARMWFKTSDRISFESHSGWYRRYREKDDDFFFLIEADGQAVGQCAIYDIQRSSGIAEIGRFLVAPNSSGRGYISRSCVELIRFGMTTLGLSYLFLEVMDRNTKAIKVYTRCGFKEEGRSGGLIRMGLRPNAAA